MASDAARFYAANIILGLEYLHSQGIAFRDLKPENLLVTSKGYLKFVDFGFAKRIPFHEDGVLKLKSGTMLGSPDYLAPELILRHGHDHTVDLWALGVIVYELIAGKPAFDEENRNAGYERACRADVVFSDKVMAACPGGVSLVKDLLVVESHDRCGAGANGMAGLKVCVWLCVCGCECASAQRSGHGICGHTYLTYLVCRPTPGSRDWIGKLWRRRRSRHRSCPRLPVRMTGATSRWRTTRTTMKTRLISTCPLPVTRASGRISE